VHTSGTGAVGRGRGEKGKYNFFIYDVHTSGVIFFVFSDVYGISQADHTNTMETNLKKWNILNSLVYIYRQ